MIPSRGGYIEQVLSGSAPAPPAVTWGNWLTLSDLDSGGSADSDPNLLLDSLTEPSAGVLRAAWTGDGTARDGLSEGVRFDISHALGGWWDGTDLAGDGSQVLIVQINRQSDINTAIPDPILAFGVYDATGGTGHAVGIEWGTTTQGVNVVVLDGINTNTGSNWAFGDVFAQFWPNSGTDSPATPANLSKIAATSTILDSSGDPIAIPLQEDGPNHAQSIVTDPTSWTLILFLGVDGTNTTSISVDFRIRIGVATIRPSLAA